MPSADDHGNRSGRTERARRAAPLAAGPTGAGAAALPSRNTRAGIIRLAAFAVIAVAGLTVAKWYPYAVRSASIAADHRMGASIIAGDSAAAPAGWHAALDYSVSYGAAVWQALVAGLLIAAGIQELVPRDWLLRLLGTSASRSTLLAGAAAVPSMMCTCCAAPAAVSLARSRASTGATIAYWLGNPVLNPATIVFMGFVLGWRWSLLRIGVGVVLVFGVAYLTTRWFPERRAPSAAVESVASAYAVDRRSPLRRYVVTLGRLCAGLLPEYAVLVLALGAVRAFLFPTMSPAAGHAVWLILLLVLTGTLMVIPTAGEVPIVGTFMQFGLGAAGSGALLITLPAISLPSLVMVGRAIPSRILAFVTGSVLIAGLVTAATAAGLGW